MKQIFILCFFTSLCLAAQAQVQINRYSETKISSKGISGKSDLSKEVIIPAIDVDNVLKRWDRDKIQKFAEPVIVNVSPFEQGLWENLDGYLVNRIKLTAKGAHSVVIYFDKLHLSRNAELFIYNSDGTVIAGPITEKENITNDKLWASNVFPGSSVILELKVPEAERNLNSIHVQKILYGISPQIIRLPTDSLMGPGFGLSSSCNVNVTCVAGWEQERRAVAQVVDEGGGWCSASLVMNACNTTKPYILTANHCIEQNGNVINTNNSTFEFLWFSPTCTPTTNTTSTLLFNGATIRARWEQSDFALLELNQVIPQTANLTFLGWSRSTSPPNSSVGIHHPMGDIMKISIENSPASIGNVRTFPNTAWRVQWDVGTVQGGSSGSPLFDQSTHRVIGQLFSNTQPTDPPCNQQSGGTNYGRFDISWDGGGTSATRLRDWLDPNNTGVTFTNTTDVANLFPVNPSLTITGTQDYICSGSTNFTINGLPSGYPVQWSVSNPSEASISSGGTSHTATISRIGSANTVVTLTVTVTNCGSTYTATHDIALGIPPPNPIEVLLVDYYTGKIQVQSEPPIPGATDYRWYKDGVLQTIYHWTFAQIPITRNRCDVGYGITVTQTNGCGTSATTYKGVYVPCDGYYYMVSPNPASSDITVSTDASKTQTNENKTFDEVRVYDLQGTLKKQQKFNKASTATINTSGLTTGTYFIEIINGHYKERHQVLIQK